MKKKLKVIAEMGSADNKALLIEMPQDMIQGLKIYADGTVDTKVLLGMLMMVEQEAALEADENAIGLPDQLDLTLNIYDQNRAAEFSHKAIG
ncbi:MAG: hypothetical protein K0R66_653 [Gammaproteobacteria bacterium]|jgi:hypothetical protein|nr:hypothetical protein [Gammaproteobacteria bacterium]